ncbi:hypothetical protein V494_06806 [Pseudogymnoascus sp. VKM F-4513 (FW-928)]|nr:hypothetical protein V494_06806 [Pseudogymnoascus sp. VKM F-4513 (FW-928)]
MATPHGAHNGGGGAGGQGGVGGGGGQGGQGGHADGNDNAADDGSEDDITLSGPTITNLLDVQLQNGEGYGVREGGPGNDYSFAGLEPHPPTILEAYPHNRLSVGALDAVNREPPYIPLDNYLHSPEARVMDLFHLLALSEDRNRLQRQTSTEKTHKHSHHRRK